MVKEDDDGVKGERTNKKLNTRTGISAHIPHAMEIKVLNQNGPTIYRKGKPYKERGIKDLLGSCLGRLFLKKPILGVFYTRKIIKLYRET
ncbi:hypothetical protein GCM10027189_16070 [Rufibacter soli]